ncbi:MAG: prepilin peptidase [bacterium]|nr:prepilin peptidase [bacterium]
MSFILFFFFVFGTIIGSFLNVVVLRYGTKTLSGRSLCFSCGKTLRWFELIPLFSFLAQEGRCRGCKARISWQYPLVELLTGLVFLSIAWKQLGSSGLELSASGLSSYSLFILHPSSFILHLLLWSLLIALSVYDLKHKIIPNALVYSASLFSFFLLLISSNFELRTSGFFLDLWSGFFFSAPFALIWFFSKGRAMGLGDAKLVVMFPWILGLSRGLSALIIGFWIGAGVSLTALLLKRLLPAVPTRFFPALRAKLAHLGMKTELPLGPFLVLGLFLVYVFGWDVAGLGLLLQAR